MRRSQGPSRPWQAAVSEGLPIYLGYGAVGMAFGAVAAEANLSPGDAVLFSAAVYAGLAQFLAVELHAAGASPWLIAGLTALVNARLMLFAAMLAPRLQGLPPAHKALVAFAVTDETVLVGVHRGPQRPAPRLAFFAMLLLIAYGIWVGATAAGFLLAGSVNVPRGVDFALPALLLAVLMLSIAAPSHVTAGAVAAGTAVLLAGLLPAGLWVLAAGGIGLAAGLAHEHVTGTEHPLAGENRP